MSMHGPQADIDRAQGLENLVLSLSFWLQRLLRF